MSSTSCPFVLAGDIGGTKTILALFDPAQPEAPILQRTFSSSAYDHLDHLIEDVLGSAPTRPTFASLAVAGPVLGGRAQVTNLPWSLDAAELAARHGLLHVDLINDLESLAWAVPSLRTDALASVADGQVAPRQPLAVIAPGTGLGEAYLTHDGNRYVAHASEGSHADFAPADERQVRLLKFLWTRLDHISYERVCSGLGLPNLYAFLRHEGMREEPEIAELLETAADPNPIVIDAALRAQSALCVETVTLLAEILAAEASNLALKVLAAGGVYLGGGIPPRILPFLRSERFRAAFVRKGRFSGFVRRVPVHVILDPNAVLRGAAILGAARAGADP